MELTGLYKTLSKTNQPTKPTDNKPTPPTKFATITVIESNANMVTTSLRAKF